MKNYIIFLFAITTIFATSCKKSSLTKKMNNSSWQLKQVELNSEDVTTDILKKEIIYANLTYSKDGNNVVFSNPNSQNVKEEEAGSWKLEKIVPTVGESYFLVRNIIDYSFERRKVFNVSEYGSEVTLASEKVLTQLKGDYIITYEKVN